MQDAFVCQQMALFYLSDLTPLSLLIPSRHALHVCTLLVDCHLALMDFSQAASVLLTLSACTPNHTPNQQQQQQQQALTPNNYSNHVSTSEDVSATNSAVNEAQGGRERGTNSNSVLQLPCVTQWDSGAMARARGLLRQQSHVSEVYGCVYKLSVYFGAAAHEQRAWLCSYKPLFM